MSSVSCTSLFCGNWIVKDNFAKLIGTNLYHYNGDRERKTIEQWDYCVKSELRVKFTRITAFSPLIFTVMFCARTALLLSGSWYRRALTQAAIETIAGSLSAENVTKRVRILALQYFSEETVKCVTLPLAILAMVSACIWGMAKPYNGRAIIGQIEFKWSLKYEHVLFCPLTNTSAKLFQRIVNYPAICMADQEAFIRDYQLFSYNDNNAPYRRVVWLKNRMQQLNILPLELRSNRASFLFQHIKKPTEQQNDLLDQLFLQMVQINASRASSQTESSNLSNIIENLLAIL